MTPSSHQPLLRVENLSKTFCLHSRDGLRVDGFSSISFQLDGGQLLALVGPSGSGKSSILKTIYRSYLPSDGAILYQGKETLTDLASCSISEVLALRRQEIGFVTQFLRVLPRVSALDSVAAPLLATGTGVAEAREEAAGLLDFLGIRRQLFGVSPLTFSGGEQQRVNIARGVIAPRRLLLLDEPTASLDSEASDRVLQLLEQLKARQVALIAIFHDMAKVERMADLICNLPGEEIS